MRVPDFEPGFDAAVGWGFFAGGQAQADQGTGDRQCAARSPLRSFLLLVHAHAPYQVNFQPLTRSVAPWMSLTGHRHPIRSVSANSALAEKRHAQNHCHSTRSMARCHVPFILFFGNWGRHLKTPLYRYFQAQKIQRSLRDAGFQNGADYRIRTDDLPLTRRLLYQLS